MASSQTAASTDRLPWLPDDPAPQAKRRSAEFVAWAAAAAVIAIMLIAGSFYWLGLNGGSPAMETQPSRSATTVALPPPAHAQVPQPEVKLERVPEVEPIVAPPMPLVDDSGTVPQPRIKAAPIPQPTDDVKSTSSDAAAPPPRLDPLEPWPVRVLEGASGRLVRIGAFSTARKAKKGWWAIVRMNPALKRLPALVVPVRSLRNGRTYYRLQMGTTSQAHSEVLCQRMRMIAQGCVVIGVADPVESAK